MNDTVDRVHRQIFSRLQTEELAKLIRDRRRRKAFYMLERADPTRRLRNAQPFFCDLPLSYINEDTTEARRPVFTVISAAAPCVHPAHRVIGEQDAIFFRK